MARGDDSMVTRHSSRAGFTLIEVMIVVIIIAVLAAIALPSYQSYIQKSRRVDARETLTRIATLQERFFFQNSSYSEDEALFGGTTSPEGWYQIAIDCSDDDCTGYTVEATPLSPQTNDKQCVKFTIDHTLRQYAEKDGGTDNSDVCWK